MKYGLIIALCLFFSQAQATIGYKVGNTAPEFKLKSLDGASHSLIQLRKQGHVLVVFWAVECVYCYAHIKEFNRAHEEFKGKLTIAAINIGGEYPPEVAEYALDNKLKYLVLSERLNNLDVGENYHAIVTPTLVLISPEGKIIFNSYRMPDLKKWLN